MGDFLDIGAGGFAEDGNGVDVGYFQGEKGIGRVLDQLGRLDVGDDDRRMEGGVKALHGLDRPRRGDADDHAIRLHKIRDGRTLPQKLRIAHHIEVNLALGKPSDGLGHFLPGPDRHGALVHDDFVTGHDGGDVARDSFHKTQIHRSVRLRRGRNGDKNEIGTLDALLRAAGEAKPAGSHILLHQFGQARFINGHPPSCSTLILLTSLSTQVTSCPPSAKQVPVTNPT